MTFGMLAEIILPQPSPSFRWIETSAGVALVCTPLESIASHLFTTRSWPLSAQSPEHTSDQAWDDVAVALGVGRGQLVRVSQVHGAGVAVAGQSSHADAADIVLSDDPDRAVAIRAADCVPLLIADRRTGAVAAAHAGWRGLASRVPAVTVAAMSREYGCAPSDLVAVIGPSIGACCYEVGVTVFDRFTQSGLGADALARWFSSTPQPSEVNPPLPWLDSSVRRGRWFFDGWAAARDQLVAAGVEPARVFVAGLCTASHSGVFCSYRRDGAGAGRLAAAIRRLPLRPHSPDDRRGHSTHGERAHR